MKNTIQLFIIILIITRVTCPAFSQAKTYVYYFDARLQPAKKEKALIIGKGANTDTAFMVKYYAVKDNRLLMVEVFKDSTLNILNGIYVVYHPNMRIAEKAYYRDNMLNGPFLKKDSIGRVTDSSVYTNDQLLYSVKQRYFSNSALRNKTITDSVQNTMDDIDYDSTGRVVREVNFTGDKGTWKEYNDDGSVALTDSVFTRKTSEAKFNGNWGTYLTQNLDPMTVIRGGATGGSGTVIAQFAVEKDGTLTNIKMLTNIGYGAEEEVLRVLKKSSKWIPAMQYGKPVRSFKKQPVTFQVNRL